MILLACAPALELDSPAGKDTGVDSPADSPSDSDDPTDSPADSDSCAAAAWYHDADGDGHGDPASLDEACEAPGADWVTEGDDCDDADPAVHPGAADACEDGVDQDCSGADAACAWSGEVDLGAFPKLHASEAYADAGRLVEVADVDGDGIPDLFVATFGVNDYAGGGYLLPGPIDASGALDELGFAFTGDPDLTYGAGRAIGLGDLDGDGIGDVAIGVPYLQNALYVFRGPVRAGRTVAEPDFLLQGPAGTYAAHGADLGDLNGDGVADAVVGAYLEPDPVAGAGVVYVKYGPVGADLDLGVDADLRLPGVEASAYTGRHLVAGGGDVDGDGLEDLLVAAPNATGGAPTSGLIYVIRGPADIGDMSGADGRLLGEAPGSSLGIGVAMALGDLDGDGLDDVAAGAYYDGSVESYGGAAYVVPGPASGDHALGEAEIVVRGAAPNQYAGSGVAIGDADRDGVADLVVGADGIDGSRGAACLYAAPAAGTYDTSEADVAFRGEAAIQFAGSTVAFGDVDGDASPELLVGAVGESTGGSNAGAVYLLAP